MPADSPHASPDVPVALAVSRAFSFHLDPLPDPDSRVATAVAARIAAAFAESPARGLLHLGSTELSTPLPPSLAFARELARLFFTHLAALPDLEAQRDHVSIPAPHGDLATLASAAPPMRGAEYLSEDALAASWAALAAEVKHEIAAFEGPVEDYLKSKSPLWHVVGRVVFHLAENKGHEVAPFAFLATYATRLSKDARVQHAPLGRAVAEHAGDRAKLLRLLEPVQRAAEKSELLRGLVDSGEIFHPLAWTPAEAYAFLKDSAAFEASGIVLRLPDWWHARNPARPTVSVSLGGKKPGGVGSNAMLDFAMSVTLDGQTLTAAEIREILQGTAGLRLIKGRWVEVDAEKLREVLDHWKAVEKAAAGDGISFLEGMRLLAGVPGALGGVAGNEPGAATEWTKITAGPWLAKMLADLQNPQGSRDVDPGKDLHGSLRPYQRDGVAWLWLLSRLRLGACLADDMGLGKTIQVLALVLLLARHGERGPHLIVLPASLLGNWRGEIERFAPSLRVATLHASAMSADTMADDPSALLDGADVVLTTYGTVLRSPWMASRTWGLVVLDEAQAIKNPAAKQTRAVKALKGTIRLALTGTPVENRLGDLWSIFDFLCPGLLGSTKAFRDFTRKLEADKQHGYAPLRNLVRPYILRRLKTDRRIITDLPDKTEVRAYCPLTKVQAALYARSVADLKQTLEDPNVEGIQRRGMILAYLMRFKQICNHPSQWLGDGAFLPADSGKLGRLRELCEPIAARDEKVLVFTQFREMTGPLASLLAEVFGRPGLVLHGETPVKKRPALVADFQRDDGPPFFVLSLKAGGTGLNLTAASHVVHFDRWWNPAVENQATDRAFRIGQKRNVLVHKFICKGTIEEKIDALIESKRTLSDDVLAGGGEAWITEMKSEDLLRLVSLDVRSALDEAS